MTRIAVAAAAVLGALVLVGPAQAVSVSVDVSADPTVGETLTIRFEFQDVHTGSYDADGYFDSHGCAASGRAEAGRPTATKLFSQNVDSRNTVAQERITPATAGTFHVCGYVYADGAATSGSPLVYYTSAVTIQEPEGDPVLNGRTTQVGLGSFTIIATCPRTCSLSGTATVTRRGRTSTYKAASRTAAGGVAKTLAFRLTSPATPSGGLSVTAQAIVTATYSSGATYTASRSITLKR